MTVKGYYNNVLAKECYSPRFIYTDFDDTKVEDERIYSLCLAKYHRETKKTQENLETVNVTVKDYV